MELPSGSVIDSGMVFGSHFYKLCAPYTMDCSLGWNEFPFYFLVVDPALSLKIFSSRGGLACILVATVLMYLLRLRYASVSASGVSKKEFFLPEQG
ncbi:MAG: hypothetical protein HRU09_20945 [Oligoflexales bacterium]|nr:hypothetical protein [Oligoflexales bacterium]